MKLLSRCLSVFLAASKSAPGLVTIKQFLNIRQSIFLIIVLKWHRPTQRDRTCPMALQQAKRNRNLNRRTYISIAHYYEDERRANASSLALRRIRLVVDANRRYEIIMSNKSR